MSQSVSETIDHASPDQVPGAGEKLLRSTDGESC